MKKLVTLILTLVIFTQSTTQGYAHSVALADKDALRPMAMKASSAGVNAGKTAYEQNSLLLQGFKESDTPIINASLAPLEPIFRNKEHRRVLPEIQLIDCVQMLQELGVKGLHIDIKDARYIGEENLKGNMDIFNPALIGDIRKAVEIPIDVHLMVMPSTKGGIDGFKDYIAEFIREGARFISVQWGAFAKDGLTKNDLRGVLRFIKENGACAGLAINPDEDVNQIIKYNDYIDYAMVMASMPGDNTRRFDKRANENLKILSSSNFDKLIAVGGDIYRNSIVNAKRYGGKWFFAGRSLLGAISATSQINSKELLQQAYRLLIEKATAVEPFPSKAQYKKWHKRLLEALEKAKLLDEQGYIKDIPTLMDLGNTFFAKGKKGRKSLRSLVVTYSAAMTKCLTQIPEGSTVYHFVLKDLGFVTDEMWQDYLAIQRLVLPDELKQIWQERLQKALSEAGLLDGENNIKDRDTLLAIEPEFFTSEEHKKDLLPIYLFYQKAVKKGKIPKDKQFTPLQAALLNLGFISPELRDEHISCKTGFPSEALRKKYTASMETALRAEKMLNKEGKIKDIGLLLDIDLEFFKSRKDEEGGPSTILHTYYMRASKYNVKKDEGSTVYHFILKDLGFVTDEMWQDYLAIKRAVRSKGQAQRWYAVLGRILAEAKKLKEGKIKDLATLLTITEKFFVSKKHKADILPIYLFYTNPVYSKRISMPAKALPACFILKDMGLVSDALWYEYLEHQGAGAFAPFPSETEKAEWKPKLEKALEKMLDEDSGMIADFYILMGIDHKLFVDDKSKGGLHIIYKLYSRALQRGQTTKPKDATVYHFILKDMNLILPSVWDQYLAYQDRQEELARKKRELKRKKEAFLNWPEKEAWRLELGKVLWKAHMLNRSRQVKGIDILMNLKPEFFTETHKELAPIYTRYEEAVNAGILKIPKTVSIQCWLLKEMGFISKELWGKYAASGRTTPSIYHRKRWHAICMPILKKAGMLSRKNMIKNLDLLLSIEPAFFTQEHKELAPIYHKYEEGVSTKQLKMPEGVSTTCLMLKDLGFITKQLWLEYIKPIWSEKIRKVVQDADILGNGGKIRDLKALLLFDNISFWHDNELWDIVLGAGKLFKEAAVPIPPAIEFHIFLLKELGFIAPELLQEYTLYKTNPLSFKFQKDEWRRMLRQVLQQDNLLDAEDEEGKIGSLDVLLNIDRSFFTKTEDTKRIYNVYSDALNRKRTIQLPQWTRLVHFILWHLDLIEPEIWDVYLSIPKDQKTAFVTTANKEKWKKRLLQDLEQAGLLNKDNKIKNLNTLLDIKAGSLLTSIYNPYSHAIKYGLIEKPESAKVCHFLLRDLNFITDDLWEEYIKYNISPILSDSTREEWLKTLRKFFPRKLIDKQGKIKDYYKLLEEANHIFCSDKRFVTIYRCYYAASTTELLQEILGIPEDVNLGFYILSDLGMVDIEQLLDILDQKLTGKLNTDKIAEAATMVMYLEPLVRETSLQAITDEQKARIAGLLDRISEAMREPRQFRLKVSRDINRLFTGLNALKKEIKALYSSQTKEAGASEAEFLKIQQLLVNELFENMKQLRADVHILRVEVSEYNRAFGEAFPIKDSVVERFRILKFGIAKLVRAFRRPELLFNEEFWKEEPRKKKAAKGSGKTEAPDEEAAEGEAEPAEGEAEPAEGEAEPAEGEAEPAEEEAEQEPAEEELEAVEKGVVPAEEEAEEEPEKAEEELEAAEEEPAEEDISKEDQEESEEIAAGSIPYKEKAWQDYTIFYAGALLDWLRSTQERLPAEEDCKMVEPEDIRETLAALESQRIKDIFQQLRNRRVDKIVKIEKLKALLRIKSKFFTSDRSKGGRNYIFKLYQKAIKDGVIEKPEKVYLHHFILHELGFISEWVWKEYMKHRDAEEKVKLKPPWKEDQAPAFPSEEQSAQWQARLEPAVRKTLNEEKDIAFIEWRHLIHRLKQVSATNLCDWGEPPIREKALEIVKGLDTDAIKAEALWHWVRNNIAYREGSGQDWDTPASATLEIGHGMSFNRANLMIAMARSIGIPAKYGIVKFGDYITDHVFVSLFLDRVRVRFDAERKPGYDIPGSELHLVNMDKEASRRAISGFYMHEADSAEADTEKKKRRKRKYSRPTIWDLVTISVVRNVASKLTAQGILPTPEEISEQLAVLGKQHVLLEELSPKGVVTCAANNEISLSTLYLPEGGKPSSAAKAPSAGENDIVSALQSDDGQSEMGTDRMGTGPKGTGRSTGIDQNRSVLLTIDCAA